MEKLKLNTVEEAIEDFKEGKFVIVVDDEDRENEGDRSRFQDVRNWTCRIRLRTIRRCSVHRSR